MKGEAKWVSALFLVAILPFLPTLWAGFLNWDDDLYLTENPAVTSPEGWRMMASEWRSNANTYPVVLAAFRLQHFLWGFHPAGYHTVNLLLHGIVTVLLFRVFRCGGVVPPAAFAAAALFAVHPMQTATVAWVSEQKSLFGALFVLAGLWAYLQGSPPPAGGEAKSLTPQGGVSEGVPHASSRAQRLLQWVSLPLLLLAYLSKSSLVVFPLFLWMTQGLLRRCWKPNLLILFHLFLALALGWIYAGRETGPEIALVDRLALVPRCLAHYLFTFFLPFQQSGVYPPWPLGWGEGATLLAVLASLLLAVVLLLARKNLTRVGIWGLIWFGVFIAPALGILRFGYQKHSFVSDHLAYLSLAGLSLFSVVLFEGRLKAYPRAGKVVFVAVLCVWMGLSLAGSFHWLSSERFWTWTLERNPHSWVAHQNLATVLDSENRLQESLSHYARSVELDPEEPIGWINLGRIRIKTGDYAGAIEALETARSLNPNYPQIESLEREARRRAR